MILLHLLFIIIVPGILFIGIVYLLSSFLIKYESKLSKKLSFWILELIKFFIYYLYFILYFSFLNYFKFSIVISFPLISLFIAYYQKIMERYFKRNSKIYKRIRHIGTFRNSMLLFQLLMIISISSNIYLLEPLKKLTPEEIIDIIWITILVDQIVLNLNLTYKHHLSNNL